MRRKSPLPVVVLLAGWLVSTAAAENVAGSASAESRGSSATSALNAGVQAFGAERYQEALDRFASVLADPKASDSRPTAAYWSVLCYLALGDQAAAETAIDSYLASWPEGDRVPDLLYQKGRVLYAKGNYESALTAFSSFLGIAPSHSLVSSALYWGGECLYSLGRLEDADKVFKSLIDRYPSSVKVEAARYKRDVIALEFREKELLRLLAWSHEESIRAADDFRSREKTYEDALSAYERQLAEAKTALASRPDNGQELKSKIAELQGKLEAAQAELDNAKAQSAATASAAQAAISAAQAEAAKAAAAAEAAKASTEVLSAKAAAEARAAAEAKAAEAAKAPAIALSAQPEELLTAALDAKKRALDLLAFYIDRLAQGGNK